MAGASPNAPPAPEASTRPGEPIVGWLPDTEVTGAWTKTQPPFVMLYTNPAHDFDVSASMAAHRIVEPLYNLFWHRLSSSCCADGGLVLDVGVTHRGEPNRGRMIQPPPQSQPRPSDPNVSRAISKPRPLLHRQPAEGVLLRLAAAGQLWLLFALRGQDGLSRRGVGASAGLPQIHRGGGAHQQ
eukprot:5504411-Prymnesium_polylepis.1